MEIKEGLVFLLFFAGCASREEEARDAAETHFFGMDTDISIIAYGMGIYDR